MQTLNFVKFAIDDREDSCNYLLIFCIYLKLKTYTKSSSCCNMSYFSMRGYSCFNNLVIALINLAIASIKFVKHAIMKSPPPVGYIIIT